MKITEQSDKKNPTSSNTRTGVFSISIFMSLVVIAMAIWMQIQATLHYQSGMEYGFIVFYPLVLAASITLFVDGVILIIHAARRKKLLRSRRILLLLVGLIFLSPTSYFAYGIGMGQYVQHNAQSISSNQEVSQLVQDCKIEYIRREYVSWNVPANQRQSTAKAYLKDSAKSQAEKESYFYGYRSFNPSYYDELAKLASSEPIKSKCGEVKLYDEHREDMPTTYNWVNTDQAIAAIDTCKISNLYTIEQPSDGLLGLASNQRNTTDNIFIVLDPISEGFSGTLYIANSDQKSHVLDIAKAKKGHCIYKQPNIDGVE
jgi:hypothetical protein